MAQPHFSAPMFRAGFTSLRNTTAQTATDSTWTLLTFDTVLSDTDGLWTSSTPSRITFKRPGVYVVEGHLEWAVNGGGERMIAIYLNGVSIRFPSFLVPPDGINTMPQQVMMMRSFAAGDYVEFYARQTVGGPLNVLANGERTPGFTALGPF